MVSTTTAAPKKTTARKAASHPTFLEMIQETIKAHPEEARQGVSRPTIKKYLSNQYKLDMSSASNTNNLSNAIKRGAEKGVLVLPKGVSGRVKLAPKAKAAAGKENVAPKKKAAAAKPKKAAAKPAAKKTAAKPAAKKATTTKKAASTTKKAPAAKAKTAATATKKKPAAPKKTAAAKK